MPEITVPMLSADGSSVADIPQSQVNNAKAGGYKLAVDMTGKDGSTATIPIDRVGDAMSEGGYTLPGASDPHSDFDPQTGSSRV